MKTPIVILNNDEMKPNEWLKHVNDHEWHKWQIKVTKFGEYGYCLTMEIVGWSNNPWMTQSLKIETFLDACLN